MFVDEAMLKKPYAVIGGVVQNIGVEKLDNMSLEIELKRRENGDTELRSIEVEPGTLSPGERGKYSLKVISDEWSGSRIVRLRSSSRPLDIVFKTLPGARRPPERIPDRVVQVTKDTRPKSKTSSGEFINTPDNPIPVP
ncbi:MAG: hypothetical protein WCD76_00170 [Pyrinomonadaceae bacterium]